MVKVTSGNGTAGFDGEDGETRDAAASAPKGLAPARQSPLPGLSARSRDESDASRRAGSLSRRQRALPANVRSNPDQAVPQDDRADEEDISRALALIEAAGRADVKLSPKDIAYVLGYERAPVMGRGLEAVKHRLPRLKSRCDRFKEVVDHLHRRAISEQQEREDQHRLTEWTGSLGPQARVGLDLDHVDSGGPLKMQPLMVYPQLPQQSHPQDATRAAFDAGHLLAWPAEALAALAPDQRTWLDTRHDVWRSLGIESGPQIPAFIDEHFECVTLHPDRPVPRELERLGELDPQIKRTLQKLQQQGATLRFFKCKQTPDAVLEAIRHVATQSQHNFVSNWLPALVKEDITPRVLQADLDRINENHPKQWAKPLSKVDEESFRGKLLERQSAEELADKLDLARSTALIQTFSQSVMCVTADAGDAASMRELAALNAKLANTFGREYAHRLLTADDANSTSEGAQAIIKSLAVMAPTVEVVEGALHLGGVARFIAASGDDVMAEAAELSALRGAGMTQAEMRKRIVFLVPFATAALGAASSIDTVAHKVGERAGGALFSVGAVMLSAVTGIMSVKYFAGNYRQLESEGKLPGHLKLPPELHDRLDELSAIDLSKDRVIAIVDDALEHCGAEPAEREAVVARMRELEAPEIAATLLEESKPAGWREAWGAGAREAMGINPARLGLTIGTYTSPLMGAALGPYFLHQPVLYAIAGSYETIVGAASIWAYRRTFDMRWNRYVDRQQAPDDQE
jgi:Arc/MetJ family transcription regulator